MKRWTQCGDSHERSCLQRRARGREAVRVRVHVEHQAAGGHRQLAVRRVQRHDLLDHGVARRRRAHELVLRRRGQRGGRQHRVARVRRALVERRVREDAHQSHVRGGLLRRRARGGRGGADERGDGGGEQSAEVHRGGGGEEGCWWGVGDRANCTMPAAVAVAGRVMLS
ncbi:hypothetical protein ON010_g16273 [Phytophthora cinnamomi]|nr:hypothetical protein ON010_g16273 [Phytophthora cinnamomi]